MCTLESQSCNIVNRARHYSAEARPGRPGFPTAVRLQLTTLCRGSCAPLVSCLRSCRLISFGERDPCSSGHLTDRVVSASLGK